VSLPKPFAGLVIRYSFLWHADAARGMEEGSKDRPCAVVLVTVEEDGAQFVTVLPVTHSPPRDHNLAVEIPRDTKKRLGLDDERLWVVVTDANRFIWPGPDLRFTQANTPSSVAYGSLPMHIYDEVRIKFIAAAKARTVGQVTRTE